MNRNLDHNSNLLIKVNIYSISDTNGGQKKLLCAGNTNNTRRLLLQLNQSKRHTAEFISAQAKLHSSHHTISMSLLHASFNETKK